MIKCEEVIITDKERRGTGETGSPIRKITQVYSKDGELIAEHDPYKERQSRYESN